jgi:hypothetical protein
MFESPDYPNSLSETTFYSWLEKGRASKIPYAYLLIIWDDLEETYMPLFVENREELNQYNSKNPSYSHQRFIAAYDLFSESRIC